MMGVLHQNSRSNTPFRDLSTIGSLPGNSKAGLQRRKLEAFSAGKHLASFKAPTHLSQEGVNTCVLLARTPQTMCFVWSSFIHWWKVLCVIFHCISESLAPCTRNTYWSVCQHHTLMQAESDPSSTPASILTWCEDHALYKRTYTAPTRSVSWQCFSVHSRHAAEWCSSETDTIFYSTFLNENSQLGKSCELTVKSLHSKQQNCINRSLIALFKWDQNMLGFFLKALKIGWRI